MRLLGFQRETAELTGPPPSFLQKQEQSGPSTISNAEVGGGSTDGTIAAVTRVRELYKVVEQKGFKKTQLE